VVAELFDRAEGFIGPCVGVKPGWVGVWRRTRGVRDESQNIGCGDAVHNGHAIRLGCIGAPDWILATRRGGIVALGHSPTPQSDALICAMR